MERNRRSTLEVLYSLIVRCCLIIKDTSDFFGRALHLPRYCLLVGLAPSLKPMPYASIVLLILFHLLPPSAAGEAPLGFEPAADTNPQELVREVVESGLRLKDKDQIHWSYREVVRKDGRLETHEVCQTNAGTIDRLIAINRQLLSAEQQRREDARLQTLLSDPSEIRKEKQKQREDSAKQLRMFAMFPKAFRYEYAGKEGRLVKLR